MTGKGLERVTALVVALVCLGTSHARAAATPAGRHVVVSGTLDVLQEDDFARGRTRRIYRLVSEDGERLLNLRPRHRRRGDLITGSSVRVRGEDAAGTLTLDDAADSLLVLEQAAAVPAVVRRAVVLIVDFAGVSGSGAGTVSCSTTQVGDLMYSRAQSSGGNFDENYAATSFGQLAWDPSTDGLAGADVFRVSIDASVSETCSSSYSSWASKADAEATSLGINLSLYQHRVYVLPNTTNCSWAGLANVGCGSSCRAWVKGTSCNTLDIFTHELGHNVGMGHASTDLDNNGAVDTSCSYWGTNYSGGEYCDRSDFMGIGGDGKRHNNGPHKLQMGWLPGDKVVDAAGGEYLVAPLGSDPAQVSEAQLLRVWRASGSYYYVTYRTNAAAYEDSLRTEYREKTFVHRHAGGSSNTLLVASLGDGQSFQDPSIGLSITQLGHSSAAATVAIDLTCTARAPSVSLSPSTQAGQPGDTLAYTLLVSNLDSASCGASTFALGANAPSGWTATLGSPSVTLAAGQQGSTTLSATSSSIAADANYDVSASATAMGGSGLSGSGKATYCVDGVGPSPVTTLSAAVKQKTKVQLTWTIPSVSGCATVASYDVIRDGAKVATTANTSYLDGSTSRGQTYSYTVVARDTVGNESGTGNVVSLTVGGSTSENCTNGVDDDNDGAVDCADSDCRRNRACR